jgi:hypothetical protein
VTGTSTGGTLITPHHNNSESSHSREHSVSWSISGLDRISEPYATPVFIPEQDSNMETGGPPLKILPEPVIWRQPTGHMPTPRVVPRTSSEADASLGESSNGRPPKRPPRVLCYFMTRVFCLCRMYRFDDDFPMSE